MIPDGGPHRLMRRAPSSVPRICWAEFFCSKAPLLVVNASSKQSATAQLLSAAFKYLQTISRREKEHLETSTRSRQGE